MGDFPQTKGGVYAFLIKRAKAKKELMPFFFWMLILGEVLKKHEAEPRARFPACGGTT